MVDPLAPLPQGTFPLSLSSAMTSSLAGKKRKSEELYAFRYAFKPGSISHSTPGVYEAKPSGSQLVFDSGPAGQVFDVREEASKPRECVLVYDEATKSFSLHPLPATLHLTLNRNASRRPASVASLASAASASTSSTSSSIGVPLSRRPPPPPPPHAEDDPDAEGEPDGDSFSSGDVRHEVSSMIGVDENHTPRPHNKRLKKDDLVRGDQYSPIAAGAGAGAARPTKGGKGLPRKRPPMESAPIPSFAPAPRTAKAQGKGKANNAAKATKGTKAKAKPKAAPQNSKPSGKGKKAAVQATPSKIKSAEYIEDSDEEAAASSVRAADEVDEEAEDEFARLVGESLAQGEGDEEGGMGYGGGGSDDDDEEEEEGESEDEDALGGARLIVGNDDNSEWI